MFSFYNKNKELSNPYNSLFPHELPSKFGIFLRHSLDQHLLQLALSRMCLSYLLNQLLLLDLTPLLLQLQLRQQTLILLLLQLQQSLSSIQPVSVSY